MARQYTSTTVTQKYPVKARFRCPVCGKENETELVFTSEAHATERGYASAGIRDILSIQAKMNLNPRAAEVANELRHGSLAPVLNENPKRWDVSPVVCSHCGTAQLPLTSKNLSSAKGCFAALLAWVVLSAAYIIALAAWVKGDSQFGILTALFCFLTIGIVAGGVLFEKRQGKLAAADPQVMKRYYNAVTNDAIEIDMSAYGEGKIPLK